MEGWLLAMNGEVEEGITQLHQGLAAYQETGGAVWRPIYLSMLAEAYSKGGQPAEALHIVDEALALVNAHRRAGLRSRDLPLERRPPAPTVFG